MLTSADIIATDRLFAVSFDRVESLRREGRYHEAQRIVVGLHVLRDAICGAALDHGYSPTILFGDHFDRLDALTS